MLPALRDMAGRYPVIGDVRGRGAMIAVELVQPGTRDAGRRPPPRLSPRPATPRACSC